MVPFSESPFHGSYSGTSMIVSFCFRNRLTGLGVNPKGCLNTEELLFQDTAYIPGKGWKTLYWNFSCLPPTHYQLQTTENKTAWGFEWGFYNGERKTLVPPFNRIPNMYVTVWHNHMSYSLQSHSDILKKMSEFNLLCMKCHFLTVMAWVLIYKNKGQPSGTLNVYREFCKSNLCWAIYTIRVLAGWGLLLFIMFR